MVRTVGQGAVGRTLGQGSAVAQVPVHLVPPAVVISGLSDPTAPEETLVVSGSGFRGVPEFHLPMADGATISLTPDLVSDTELRVTVPAGCASGLVSVTMWHGELSPTTSNAVPFTRLPRLRLHAPQQDLAAGEAVALQVVFLGADPLPLTWSADVGSVASGTFRAPPDLGADGFARVTACISGTRICDTVVLGLHAFRIEPPAGLVRPGETIMLAAVGASGPLAATWQVRSGGGAFGGGGEFTASSAGVDAGPVVVAATVGAAVEQAPLGVWGAFPGLIARASEYADFRNAPLEEAGKYAAAVAVEGDRAYVVAGGPASGEYGWVDVYDVAQPSSPRWLGAAAGSTVRADRVFAAGGGSIPHVPAQCEAAGRFGTGSRTAGAHVRSRRGEVAMDGAAKRLLYWTPRVLCIVFAAFISIFAMDVFQKGVPLWQVALDLLMHLLPTFLVLSVLALSWRREWVGGALFIALGLLYLLWARNKPFFGWEVVLLIAAPLFLVGVLFLLNWRYRAQLRPGS